MDGLSDSWWVDPTNDDVHFLAGLVTVALRNNDLVIHNFVYNHDSFFPLNSQGKQNEHIRGMLGRRYIAWGGTPSNVPNSPNIPWRLGCIVPEPIPQADQSAARNL